MRALIVGCSTDIRSAITGMLRPYEFDCVSVRDGLGALQYACTDAVDLFIIDFDRPEVGGRELLELIRCGRFGPDPPPAIICSADGRGIVFGNTPLSGAGEHTSPRELTPAIADALARAFREEN